MKSIVGRFFLPALMLGLSVLHAEANGLRDIFARRGFDPDKIILPKKGELFPIDKLKVAPEFTPLVSFEEFPEGPSYRPQDDSYFFAGNVTLRRLSPDGNLHTVLARPQGAGGTHLLPDGSMLVVGAAGLLRVMTDGRIAVIADGKEIGKANDITMGIHGEIYFTVPERGIFRVTPGDDGKIELVSTNGGNGLDVDPAGKFLYVHQAGICRYAISGADKPLGEREQVFKFPKGEGGADGCTFDAWGNLYSVRFRYGAISILDPGKGKPIAEIDIGVKPATNLTFGGPDNTTLFITAGAPKFENCQVLKVDLGITGFCGHAGSDTYPVMRYLDERADKKAFLPPEVSGE